MNGFITMLNSAGRTFVSLAAPVLIQSSVLILAVLILDLFLRRRLKAVVRYWIWLLVLVKLVLPPTLAAPTSLAYWIGAKLPSLPTQVETVSPEQTALRPVVAITEHPVAIAEPRFVPPVERPAEQPAEPAELTSAPPSLPVAAAPAATALAPPPAPVTWQAVAFLVWLFVVAVMAVLLIQRAFFVRGLVLQSTETPRSMVDLLEECRQQMGVSTAISLRLTSLSTSPSVCGLWKPRILMPHDIATQLDAQQFKSIVLHELAHVKRGDLWINLVQALLQIAYFFHPLLWLANLMIRRVREQAVDETVLAAMGDEAEDYPRTLLNVSKLAFGRPALSLRLIGVVESKQALTARIKHIVSRPFPKSAKLGLAGLVLIATVAAVLLPMARAEKSENLTVFTDTQISAGLAHFNIDPNAGKTIRVPYWHEGLDLDSAASVPMQNHWPTGMDINVEAELRNGLRIEDFVAVRLGEGEIDEVAGRRILTLKSDTVGAAAAELNERYEEFRNSNAVMNGFYTDDLPTFFAVLSDGIVSPTARLTTREDAPAPGQQLWLIRLKKARSQDVEIEYWQGEPLQDVAVNMSEQEVITATVMPGSEAVAETETSAMRTIHGIVTDTLGRPRECARVAPRGTRIWDGAMSDTEGHFTLENVTPEQTTWIAYSQASRLYGFITLPRGNTQPIRVILNLDEADLSGRVVGADGKALAEREVEVVVTAPDGSRFPLPHRPKTDSYGYYSHNSVPCGAGISLEAHVANDSGISYSTGPVEIHAGKPLVGMPLLIAAEKRIQPDFDRNVRDDGMLHCRGRVLDENGDPIEGVRIQLLFDMSGWMSLWVRDAVTDAQGRWHREVPAQASRLTAEFDHPEYYLEKERQTPSTDELKEGTHVITMKRGLVLQGRVVNEQGQPVDNVLVCAKRSYASTPSPYNQIVEDSTTDRTRHNGTFRIGGLAPGERMIAAYSNVYAPTLQTVDIQDGMPTTTVTLAKGKTYRGRVVDCKGQPVEGVRVGVQTWRQGKEQRRMSRLAQTDAQGNFALTNLPEGQIGLYFGKKPLMGFSKSLPEDLSETDVSVMYEVPVFTGKVIDAETNEPITAFRIVDGIKWRREDASFDWSRYYRDDLKDPNGAFSHRWGGYGISYPLASVAGLRFEAPGYVPGTTPPQELDCVCEPLVIRLRKGVSLGGIVQQPDGRAAAKAQVGFVAPGEMAFIDGCQFSEVGYAYQADIVETADENGHFELPPTEAQGLIVAVHKSGYAQIPSQEFVSGATLSLTAWSRVEGTIDRAGFQDENTEITLQALEQGSRDAPSIYWAFNRIAPTGDTFAVEYMPAIPVALARVYRYEPDNATFLQPEPGKTYSVAIGAHGRPVTGQLFFPPEVLKDKSFSLTDPRQTHAVAFRIDEGGATPPAIAKFEESSFQWFWHDKEDVYTRSQRVRKRSVPRIDEDGQFTFPGLEPGEYEFVVNIHAPLGENITCGRGVLEGITVVRFSVPEGGDGSTLRLPHILVQHLTYPGAGEPAPLFEAKTFDGQTVRLADLHGKVVLLDFWASWCSPCVAALPKMQALHDAFANEKDFAMVGLSLDSDLERARGLIDREALNWTQVSLGLMDESVVVKQYGVGGIPMTILIDTDGTILARGANVAELKPMIEKALAKQR